MMEGHRPWLRLMDNARMQPARKNRKFLFYGSIFGVAFSISCLYHGMRGVMRLGGMVASGGPYAITHPAPSWVWIMPVAIMFGMACFFINLFCSDPEGVNLMPLAWPGLFLSLGWNFLEFAFSPPGGGLAWGWLICGVVFVLMGGVPLWLAFKAVQDRTKLGPQDGSGPGRYAAQWLLAAAGVLLAIVFFKNVAA